MLQWRHRPDTGVSDDEGITTSIDQRIHHLQDLPEVKAVPIELKLCYFLGLPAFQDGFTP